MHHWKYATATICSTAVFLLVGPLAEARPRIYVEVQDVRLPKNACGLDKPRVRAVLVDALQARPEVTLDLGQPVKREDLAKVLKARRLQGYAVVLRATECNHQVQPPAKGKAYRVLMVEVGVAIDAERIPTSQMALAGEGSSQVGTEISQVREKERLELLDEALVAATKQAVDKSIAKLSGSKSRDKRPRRRRR